MKKRIIGIFGAHLLQLGIQVRVRDVTALLLLVGGFAWRVGLALGRIRLLRVGCRQVVNFSASASGCVNRCCSSSSSEELASFKKIVGDTAGHASFKKVGDGNMLE